jgi:multiple sugar transport system permease protein
MTELNQTKKKSSFAGAVGGFYDKAKRSFDSWKAWIYLSPAIVLLLVFTAWPIFNTIKMAFTNGYNSFDALGGKSFTFGIQNFISVMVEFPDFVNYLINTMLLCIATVPISTILALLIAVCLNSIKPLQKFLQTIFFLPYVTNSIAIGMVFSAMFNVIGKLGDPNANIGVINKFLGMIGIDPINWINTGTPSITLFQGTNFEYEFYYYSFIVLVIYIVWNALPFKILVLLGGLQGINKQYYEAAKIDATPRWRVFTRITVPLLSPMLAYVIITSFIGGFKEYSSIVGIFNERMGPFGDYEWGTMVGYIYKMLPDGWYGDASAAAIILFLIIFAVTLVNLYVSNKKTHY